MVAIVTQSFEVSTRQFVSPNLQACGLKGSGTLSPEDTGMPPSSTCKAAGQQLVKWHRSADSVALQLSGDVLQVNSLSSHKKVIIWRQSGELIITLLSPAGVASSRKLSGPWSSLIRQTVQAFLGQLGNLAVCGNN